MFNRVLTTTARKPPLRSARFEAEIALLPLVVLVVRFLHPAALTFRFALFATGSF
jgi:hypothetical protein